MSQQQQPPPNSSGAAVGSYPGPPPAGYAGYPPQYASPPPQNARPPLVSIISPEVAKKIRKMQYINFAATLLQLGCSLGIILIVRNNLFSVTISNIAGAPAITATCLAATPSFPGTCEYAYSLASVSIFFGFILSLMQCLTMDCCGAGRAIEAGFDAAACAWWIAGGITLGLRASEASAMGLPQRAAREAVVALCWLSAALFLVLLVTNLVLIKRLGRAYKAAAQQMQQHLTAYPVTPGYAPGVAPGGVQMVPMDGQGPYPQQQWGNAGQQQWGAAPAATGNAPQQQQQQPPPGYPTQFTPPPVTGPNAV